ncbi:hypothetical protein KGF57_001682 [Candida theae]|uniref:Tetratricopeptide SHNi-TPR domain-containing protein n=1 Tax=Candida theae TaxID=1198502 RepID=A0AAD5BGJ4_9ASCO|nr:uncharacterized protein KGF57_001682 [Candida theae]KAI5961557.1 hypothetical protein KGF57_001682 [Candida theae]
MPYSDEVNRLVQEGSKSYASKEFDLASEKYGKACEVFSTEHEGEEDGDLLFLYGKALFQSGVSKSEVLGGVSASGQGDAEENEENGDSEDADGEGGNKFQFYDAEPIEGEVAAENSEQEEGDAEEKDVENENAEEKKDEGGEDEEADEESGQEPGDLEMAWIILDATRAVFEKQLESAIKPTQLPPYISKPDDAIDNDYVKVLKKLSETYDILGEVSLEMENFPQSAQDFTKSLELRSELFPFESPLVSESHYKLALALEFCVEDGGQDVTEARQNAAKHIQEAIKSTEARNEKETDASVKKDNEEMIGELKEKYQDLIKDPSEQLQQEQLDIMKGILGSEAAGANAGQAIINNLTSIVKKKGEEGNSSSSSGTTTTATTGNNNPAASAPKPVNDLSGLVKKRKPSKDHSASKKARK